MKDVKKAVRNLKERLNRLNVRIDKVDNLLRMLKEDAREIAEILNEETETKLDEQEPESGFDLKSFRDRVTGGKS